MELEAEGGLCDKPRVRLRRKWPVASAIGVALLGRAAGRGYGVVYACLAVFQLRNVENSPEQRSVALYASPRAHAHRVLLMMAAHPITFVLPPTSICGLEEFAQRAWA